MENKHHTYKRSMSQGGSYKENKKTRNYSELNENENVTYQHWECITKAMLRRKFISLESYIRKEKGSQINNLTFHLEKLKKRKSKQNKKMKVRTETN